MSERLGTVNTMSYDAINSLLLTFARVDKVTQQITNKYDEERLFTCLYHLALAEKTGMLKCKIYVALSGTQK